MNMPDLRQKYILQIAQGRNRLAFLAILAALVAVFQFKAWYDLRDLDQRVTDAANAVEGRKGGPDSPMPVIIGPKTSAFRELALGETSLALVCGFSWWLAGRKPKIAFVLSAITGLALIFAATYGFSLVPEQRMASSDTAKLLRAPDSRAATPDRPALLPRAVVMASLPALLVGFFLVGFSLSSLRAANALSREP